MWFYAGPRVGAMHAECSFISLTLRMQSVLVSVVQVDVSALLMYFIKVLDMEIFNK